MKYLIVLFSLITFSLFGQSGIEPSSLQGTPYKGGVMVGVTPIIDEFTGDTIYLYQHSDTSFVKIDSLVFTDSLRLYTSQGVFTTYISSGGGSGDITEVTVSAPITGGSTSGSVNIGIDTTSITGAATQYDLTLKQNTLVSGANIKTFNSGSLLGSGNVTALSSLNALTGATQTFATGTSGTDFNISSTGTTHTFNLPTVSATATGVVDPFTRGYWNSKLDGNGDDYKVAFWIPSGGTKILSNNSIFHWDNTNNRLGVGTASPLSTLDAYKLYTNTTEGNVVASGNVPLIAWNKTSSYRFALGSGYTNASTLSFLGASTTGSNPTTQLIDIGNDGFTRFYNNTQVDGNVRIASTEFSFGHLTTNPTDAQFYVNLGSSKRFRIQSAAGLGYMDFYTLASGGNRNFSFATSYNSAGDFNLLRSTTAGGTPNTLVWTANSTGFGIGTGSPSNTLDVDGTLRVRTTTGTATSLMGRDANGVMISVPISGLTMSSGTLTNSNTGTVTGSGTTNAIPYWTSTTALGSMPVTYSTALPAVVFPSGNAIHLVGTATIIDKANSYGGTGKFLSKPSDGSGGVLWDTPTFTIRNGLGGSSAGFGILPNNILDIQAGQNMEVETDFTSSTNPKLTLNAITYYAQLSNNALITPTLDNTNRIVDFGIANESNNTQVDADITTNLITADVSCNYEVSYNLSYTLPTPALRDVTFKIYKAGSDIGYNYTAYSTHLSSTSSVWTPVSKTFHVFLTAGETIGLYYISSGSSTTINIASPVLSLKKLD